MLGGSGEDAPDVHARCEKGKAMSEWQPIKTVPKDGTPVVLAEWSEHLKRWQFRVSYWRNYMPGFGEGFGWIGHAPTHWMPEPPR